MVAFFFIGAFCAIVAVIAMVVAFNYNDTNSNDLHKPNLFFLVISIIFLCLAVAFWTTAAIYADYNEMRARLAYGNNVIAYDLPAEKINELGIDLKDPAIVYSKAYYVRDILSNGFFGPQIIDRLHYRIILTKNANTFTTYDNLIKNTDTNR